MQTCSETYDEVNMKSCKLLLIKDLQNLDLSPLETKVCS